MVSVPSVASRGEISSHSVTHWAVDRMAQAGDDLLIGFGAGVWPAMLVVLVLWQGLDRAGVRAGMDFLAKHTPVHR